MILIFSSDHVLCLVSFISFEAAVAGVGGARREKGGVVSLPLSPGISQKYF